MNETKLAQLRKEALTSIELRPDMKDISVNTRRQCRVPPALVRLLSNIP